MGYGKSKNELNIEKGAIRSPFMTVISQQHTHQIQKVVSITFERNVWLRIDVKLFRFQICIDEIWKKVKMN